MIPVKNASEIEKMRRVSKVVAGLLKALGERVRPGVSTLDLDQLANVYLRENGAVATFLGYHGYPASICTSVNEQVVHGIPSHRRLVEGDIIGIDVGATLDGFVGDAARTFAVGKVSEEALRLMQVTREALELGLAQVRPGNRLQDIGAAVQAHVEGAGYSIVRDFVGHGVGRKLHEEPQIPNYGRKGLGPKIQAGMTFAIEPMVNAGGFEIDVLADGWTAVTRDRRLSAHFEDTVLAGPGGPEILTR